MIWGTVIGVWVARHLSRLLLARLGLLLIPGDRRDAEILALRHQVLVLQREINLPKLTSTDRTILAVLPRASDRSQLGRVMLIVKPDTVIGWRRRLVARQWTQPPTPRTGRHPPQPRYTASSDALTQKAPQGATGESTANSTASGTAWTPRSYGRLICGGFCGQWFRLLGCADAPEPEGPDREVAALRWSPMPGGGGLS